MGGKQGSVAIKSTVRDPHSNGTVLYFDCIIVNILVRILQYSFA